MTQISPRATGDMAVHRDRMRRLEMYTRLCELARDAVLVLSILTTAALSGYLLGIAHSTIEAMPQIVSQSQACAAW